MKVVFKYLCFNIFFLFAPNTSVNDIIKGFPCNAILFCNAELYLLVLGFLISLGVLSSLSSLFVLGKKPMALMHRNQVAVRTTAAACLISFY